jgi:hydroxymethylbilane synthase
MSMTTSSDSRVLRLGTRGSTLALWQAGRIAERIRELAPGWTVEEVVFTTRGDRELDTPLPSIGGKGVFTEELEAALRSGGIDLAVHSLKDLPTRSADGIAVGAVCCREDVRDALVSRTGMLLSRLPAGAVIGTSSTRRAAQLRAVRSDLDSRPIRGNVETRLRKVDDGDYDATILAVAGLVRLGLADRITEYLPLEMFLPAPGQAALAVQFREGDTVVGEVLDRIDEPVVRACTEAERTLLAALGGGCSVPVAALAEVVDGSLLLRASVGDPATGRVLRADARGDASDPSSLGRQGAARLLADGAAAFLS